MVIEVERTEDPSPTTQHILDFLLSENDKPPTLFSEVTQSCPTLCDPMDYSLPGSSVYRIFQARILEWVAITFPEDLPDPGIEPGSPALQADFLPSEPPEKSLKN